MIQAQADATVSQASNPMPGGAYPLRAIPAVAAGKVVQLFRRGQSRKSDADAVFARYDLMGISPREIDEMAAELTAAGFRDTSFIKTLTLRGEAALTQAREGFAKIGYHVSMFDADEKLNLLQLSRDQLKISQSFGAPTVALENFILELERLESERPRSTPVPPAPAVAPDVLVLTQERRV